MGDKKKNPLDRVKERMKKIKRLMEGAQTEGEYMAALTMLNKLGEEHSLDPAAINTRDEGESIGQDETDITSWMAKNRLVMKVGKMFGVHVHTRVKYEPRKRVYVLTGKPHAIFLTKETIKYLEEAIMRLGDRYLERVDFSKFKHPSMLRSAKLAERKSFSYGCRLRLSERIEAIIRERRKGDENEQKYGLIIVDDMIAAKAYVERAVGKLRKRMGNSVRYTSGAYSAGMKAGSKIGLNAQVTRGGQSNLLGQ